MITKTSSFLYPAPAAFGNTMIWMSTKRFYLSFSFVLFYAIGARGSKPIVWNILLLAAFTESERNEWQPANNLYVSVTIIVTSVPPNLENSLAIGIISRNRCESLSYKKVHCQTLTVSNPLKSVDRGKINAKGRLTHEFE